MSDKTKFIEPSELIFGKWYVALDIGARLEDNVVAGPFDSLVDAEAYSLPGELIPSQFGVFEFGGNVAGE